MIRDNIKEFVSDILINNYSIQEVDVFLEHPENIEHGDYSTNVALVYAKELGKNPRELADEIVEALRLAPLAQDNLNPIDRIEVAGPGFINFFLTKEFFKNSLGEIIEAGESYGRSDTLGGEKTMVEYTDPNPFKELHIGHLMSNTIGESISRILEWNGAEVKRACYQGDVGMHVARAVWALGQGVELGEAYAVGTKAYMQHEGTRFEIQEINRKIYSGEDKEVNRLYEKGKNESLELFDKMYEKLGTSFDYFFFESESAPEGEMIVRDNLGEIFEESEGAIVFKADKYDSSLHTRVFINSDGLPTYEAKELGLAPLKYETYEYDKSIVITGNEVDSYFRVVLEAMNQVLPELREKTHHISHGMLKLTTGKMSSRTGEVITAESLIEEVKEKTDGREDVAIGAIKYMILRQSPGSDIVFDLEKSVSTDGDSGVYLQYAHARAASILDKASIDADPTGERSEMHEIEKRLYIFPEVLERAVESYAPNLITTYLTELAASFNNFYAHEEVLGDSPEAPYRLALVKAFKTVMKNGLDALGIPAPERV